MLTAGFSLIIVYVGLTMGRLNSVEQRVSIRPVRGFIRGQKIHFGCYSWKYDLCHFGQKRLMYVSWVKSAQGNESCSQNCHILYRHEDKREIRQFWRKRINLWSYNMGTWHLSPFLSRKKEKYAENGINFDFTQTTFDRRGLSYL